MFSPSHLAVVVVRWVLLPLLGGLQDLVEDLDDVRAVAGGDKEEREIPLGGKVEGLGGHLGVAERYVGASASRFTIAEEEEFTQKPYLVVDVDLVGHHKGRDSLAVF